MNDKVIAMSIVDTIKIGRFWLSKGNSYAATIGHHTCVYPTQAIAVSNHNNQYREQ
ncbi:hypothetical protein MGMO_11c00740 [Methyloglobulus morosus KoM1]|uniref:Uncharacterized protein n=1 Tax=Methyloglobulus morosus KoM1 TaxID=1116472 RepID=V5C5L9_9GAMM|nr:hypothetical protein [Methyloglobulus morosus]ESS73767.1 hypothetical protein MGMO_11c00740 [Methyloglobulus morosus KoM1]